MKQSASTFRKEKEKAQIELDHASKLSALKKKTQAKDDGTESGAYCRKEKA